MNAPVENAAVDPTVLAQALARLEPEIGTANAIGIVLGTGLGGVAEAVQNPVVIPYSEIPGFPENTVSGHAGRLVAGEIEGRRVVVMQGRAHYYETTNAAAMRVPLEVMRKLGMRTIILTNAAGSLKKDFQPGHICVVTDHINLSGTNPLLGDRGDGRFVSMTDAYAPRLRARLKRSALAAGVRLHEGVYCWMSGPSFETPAEIRMIRTLGGDLVGMSTVPEVILARRLGIDVTAISIVTNYGAGIENASPSHTETKDVAATGGIALRRLILAFLKGLDDV